MPIPSVSDLLLIGIQRRATADFVLTVVICGLCAAKLDRPADESVWKRLASSGRRERANEARGWGSNSHNLWRTRSSNEWLGRRDENSGHPSM